LKVSGYPIAVEAVGHSMLDLHARERLRTEVSRIDDHELTAIFAVVVEDGHHEAVIF